MVRQLAKKGLDLKTTKIDGTKISLRQSALYDGLAIMRITNRYDDSVRESWIRTMHAIFAGTGK